jgi:lysophospholipase L1-like esterase
VTKGTFTTELFTVSGAGAVARTSPDRLADAINVCDFGADPTGVADSLPAFKLAIKAARSQYLVDGYVSVFPGQSPDNVKGMGTVYVPRGKYLVTNTVELIPSDGTLIKDPSFALRGESAASTMIFGNFVGWILTSGITNGMTGTFVIENLSIYNNNRTPYTSGCVLNGGQTSSNRNLILSGMVGLALQSNTCWGSGAYSCIFLGPGLGINSLGVSQCTDSAVLSSCYFTNWDTALLTGQNNPAMLGSVFERNRVGIDCGGAQGAEPLPGAGFAGGRANDHFGANHAAGAAIAGHTFRSNGISIKTAGSSAGIEAVYIDCTPAIGINPTSGNNVQDGMRLSGLSGGLTSSMVIGGPINGLAYNISNLGHNYAGMARYIGMRTDVPYAQRGGLPPGHTDSVDAAAEASLWIHQNSDVVPVWTFNDLAWSMAFASNIKTTTLNVGVFHGSRGLGLQRDFPSWLFGTVGSSEDVIPVPVFGTGVTPGTLPTVKGTQFSYPTIDDGTGTGAAGAILTYLDFSGPLPVAGALLRAYNGHGHNGANGYIDDGTGTGLGSGAVTHTGDKFTFRSFLTLSGATISDGAGGPGNILSFASASGSPINSDQIGSGGWRVAIGINGAGGIPRVTFVTQQLSPTSYRINRTDLKIPASGTTTIYILPDYRPGYYFDEPITDFLGRTAPVGTTFNTELTLFTWQLSTSTSWGPAGPIDTALFGGGDLDFTLVSQRTSTQPGATQWNITGEWAPIAISVGSTNLPFTYLVNISQDSGVPDTLTFVLDEPGHAYQISDSPYPAWTSNLPTISTKIMPLGDSITQGQNTGYGSYRRTLYSLLTSAGITVDFVGALSDGAFADPNHEGHTGEGIVSIWARVETDGIIQSSGAKVVLLMIGTNDIWSFGTSPATALGQYNSLLNAITLAAPTVKVLVSSIPPVNTAANANVIIFNDGLRSLVASKGGNFYFIDTNKGLTLSDLADGVHPTDAGNDKLAALWFPAVMTVLDAGTSNVGRVVGAGNVGQAFVPGATNRVQLKFDQRRGYTIAG